MQQPQHHHHKPKPSLYGSSSWIRRSPPPSPHKKPWGAGGRSRYACRLVPLLVLTLYSLFTVLRIPRSSLVINTVDSERVERRDDVEAFKTHPTFASQDLRDGQRRIGLGRGREEREGRTRGSGWDRQDIGFIPKCLDSRFARKSGVANPSAPSRQIKSVLAQ